MAKGTNLKINMTAENSDLVQKAKESKAAIRDFEKVSSDAVSKLGEAFGVNTGKIEQMASAVRGLGARMEKSGDDGAKAFGKLLTSVGGLSTAIAGIGIGAVVTGFKLLNEEATAFKNTVQGANIEMATAAYISTYSQALHDANEALGRSTAETFASVSKKWKTFWAEAAFVGVNIISETMESGFDSSGDRALDNLYAVRGSAEQQANKAEAYMKRIFNIQRLISDSSVEWKKMEREIAEYKRIAYDKTASTVERQEALAKVTELIHARYEDEAILRERLANMQAKMNDLTNSSIADIDKANQLRIQAAAATENMNNKLREVGELQATLAANAQKEADARAQALAYAQAMAQSRADLQAWDSSVSSGNTLKESLPTSLPSPDAGLAIPVTPVLNTDSVIDLTQELQSIMTSAFDSIGTSLGGLIGDLATGGDAWGNFTNTAISAFGDMAVSIGKMAIQTGVATLGIKAALESLNGWVAIAAGTALVALGSAVKTGLSNIASGGYSSSASVATSGNYGSSPSVSTAFDTREMNIKVSGNLYASGNQLMAVIENENNRKNHTT